MKKYYLFHMITRRMSGPFTLEAMVESLLAQDSLQNMSYWFEGQKDWAPVESNFEIVELLQRAKGVQMPAPPPPPPGFAPAMAPGISTGVAPKTETAKAANQESTLQPTQEVAIVLEPESNTEKLTIIQDEKPSFTQEEKPAPVGLTTSSVDNQNQRVHPRIQCHLRTIITNKKKTFITSTVDISMGGIKVSHVIPEEIFQGDCEVYVTGPENLGSILIQCKPVTHAKNSERFSFVNLDEKNKTKLKAWYDQLMLQARK